MDQNGVGSSFGIRGATAKGFGLAQAGDQRLGACDDDASCGSSGFDLPLEFLDPDEFLPAVLSQAAVLGEGLILHHDTGHPGRNIARHHVGNGDRVAEAGVDIGQHRRILRRGNGPHHLKMRVSGKNAGVRDGVGGGEFEAAAPDDVEPGHGGQLRRERIVCRHGHGGAGNVQFGTECIRSGHAGHYVRCGRASHSWLGISCASAGWATWNRSLSRSVTDGGIH